MRCSECGFKSDFADFFRRERGGLFGLPEEVCEACEVYQPSASEKKTALLMLIQPLFMVIAIVPSLREGAAEHLVWLLLMVLFGMFTLPSRFFIHEMGHAVAARLCGHIVTDATVGRGPVSRRIRVLGTVFRIRRYPWMGGYVRHVDREGHYPGIETIFIAAAGPVANILLGVAAFVAAVQTATFFEPLAIILSTYGVFNLLTGLYNLLPGKPAGSFKSDGRRMLEAFKPREPVYPALTRFLWISALQEVGRHEEALAETGGWHLSPLRAPMACLILWSLARSRGERAAVDFWMQHEPFFSNLVDSNISRVEIRGAACALGLGDPQFATRTEEAVTTWWTVFPDEIEYSGTYGAWLVSVGRAEEGIPRLIKAVRETRELVHKASLCRFLSEGWRQQGDEARASAYLALEKRYLAETTS
jgi:Zn-dependent protease